MQGAFRALNSTRPLRTLCRSVGETSTVNGFNAEPYLQVFGPDGQLRAVDSEISNAEIQFIAQKSGTYTAIVQDNGNDDQLSYSIVATGISSVSPGIPGDYDRNGTVQEADFLLWRATFGQHVVEGTGADGNQNGVVDAADYTVWRDNLGTSGGMGSSAAAAAASSNTAESEASDPPNVTSHLPSDAQEDRPLQPDLSSAVSVSETSTSTHGFSHRTHFGADFRVKPAWDLYRMHNELLAAVVSSQTIREANEPIRTNDYLPEPKCHDTEAIDTAFAQLQTKHFELW
jgi:hypothetical protein